MTFKEELEVMEKEKVIDMCIALKKRNSTLINKMKGVEYEKERADEKWNKAELIEQNFNEQLKIQTALRTKEITDGYLEYVRTITELIKECKK